MDTMVKMNPASMGNGFYHRRWRIFAAAAALLLLTVQIGLAIHGATHLHAVGQNGDCQLCVLNSNFIAEPSIALDLEPALLVVVLSHEEAGTPADSTPRIPTARGPPTASV